MGGSWHLLSGGRKSPQDGLLTAPLPARLTLPALSPFSRTIGLACLTRATRKTNSGSGTAQAGQQAKLVS